MALRISHRFAFCSLLCTINEIFFIGTSNQQANSNKKVNIHNKLVRCQMKDPRLTDLKPTVLSICFEEIHGIQCPEISRKRPLSSIDHPIVHFYACRYGRLLCSCLSNPSALRTSAGSATFSNATRGTRRFVSGPWFGVAAASITRRQARIIDKTNITAHLGDHL